MQPHPIRDRGGHSYGLDDTFGDLSGWRTVDWRDLEPWLWGADLFNRFYFWEAHEAWESLWRTTARDADPGLLLQGLIQSAAALLKIHLRSAAGASSLSSSSIEKLNRVATHSPFLMGMDVAATTRELRSYFSPLAAQVLPSLDGGVPILRMAAAATPHGSGHD